MLQTLLGAWPQRRFEVVEVAMPGLTLRYQPGFAGVPDRMTFSAQGCGSVQLLRGRAATDWSFGGDVEGAEARCAWRALRACAGQPARALLFEATAQGSYSQTELVAALGVERAAPGRRSD